jgi:hypothetical protein
MAVPNVVFPVVNVPRTRDRSAEKGRTLDQADPYGSTERSDLDRCVVLPVRDVTDQ